jgi:hypothetical protein
LDEGWVKDFCNFELAFDNKELLIWLFLINGDDRGGRGLRAFLLLLL